MSSARPRPMTPSSLAPGFDPARVLKTCSERVRAHRDRAIFPQYTTSGTWRLTDPSITRPGFMPEEAAWTAGFWPGMLWIASATLDDAELATRAEQLVALLRPRATDDRTHDLGFVFMPSAVLGSVVSGRRSLLDGALEAGATLVARWDENGGYLRAWGEPGSVGHEGLTTIDAMMNAAFVLWMAESTANDRARTLALRHADNALRNQLRSDGSTIQVARYDPKTGRFLGGGTHQGLSSASCWSRGQSWAIYGFALFALQTGDRRFAEAAQAAADYFVAHLLPDGMAPWDFLDPTESRMTADSSAMAIAAAGLLCLSATTGDDLPSSQALGLIETLVDRAMITNDQSSSLLAHGTFSLPRNVGVDESLIFGDFYFMDALARAVRAPFGEYMRPQQ